MKFKRPENALEGHNAPAKQKAGEAAGSPSVICPKCKKKFSLDALEAERHTCPYCRHHFRISARRRISMIADGGTFAETDAGMVSSNVLGFPGYDEKLAAARLKSAERDSVVCGECEIGGKKAALFAMEPNFMMGSLGSAAGEKITRLFERAAEKSLPVVGFAVSGGARMQEGILSLMQMAKTSGAVRRHGDAGNLYISVLTDPTTGGVTASFAMEADIIIAEPEALIGFAGPRVIEQTIRKKLPAGFQSAEFQFEHGFIDDIVDRKKQKEYLALLLGMHERRAP